MQPRPSGLLAERCKTFGICKGGAAGQLYRQYLKPAEQQTGKRSFIRNSSGGCEKRAKPP